MLYGILITCRQPFSEEIILPAVGVAKVGVSLLRRESGIDLESAGSTRSTAVYGAFIERNRLVSGGSSIVNDFVRPDEVMSGMGDDDQRHFNSLNVCD